MRTSRKFKRPAARFTRLAAGFAVLVIVLTGMALIVPGYIDWNRYKSEIETQASALLGRQVKINGAIGFRLLPRPELSLSDVTLASAAGALDAVLLDLSRLETHLSVLPLFSGKFEVGNIRLIRPVLKLETLPDGEVSWPWQDGAMTSGNPDIRFEQIVIEQGSLHYSNQITGSRLRLDDINTQLTAGSLRGPFAAIGSVTLQEVPVRFDATLDEIKTDRLTALEVKAQLEGDIALNFSGKLSALQAISGNFHSAGADLTALTAAMARFGIAAFAQAQPDFLRLPYRLDGGVSLATNHIMLDKLKLAIGENTVTGSLSWDTSDAPFFEIIVSASSLDLDTLPAPAKGPLGAAGVPAAEYSGGFEIPQDLQGAMRLNAKAVKLNGSHIRDVMMTATLSGGAAAIENASASLPGNTATKLSGTLTAQQGQPKFTGRLDVDTQNLRALLRWLDVSLPDLPERSLNRATLTGLLEFSPMQLDMQKIDAEIDSSRISASLALALRDRLALGVNVHIDQLNADNYLSVPSATPPIAPGTDQSGPDITARWATVRQLAQSYDSNFKLSIDQLIYRGIPVADVKTEGALIGGTLAVNNFSIADIADSAISLSGIYSNFLSQPEGELNLRIASNNLDGLAHALDLPLPLPGAQLGKSRIDTRLLIANAALEAQSTLQFADTTLQLNGTAAGIAPGIIAATGAPLAINGHISLTNPSLRKFAAHAGWVLAPAAAEEAAGINLTADISGTADEISLTPLAGAIGTVPLHGAARWLYGADRPALKAEISAGEILLENFSGAEEPGKGARGSKSQQVPWSGIPFDFTWLDKFDIALNIDAVRFVWRGFDMIKPAARLSTDAAKIELQQSTNALFGGEAQLKAILDRASNEPQFHASWQLRGVDLAPVVMALTGHPSLTGQLDFSGEVKGAGITSFAIASSLEGNGQITASNGFIQGLDLQAFGARLESLERAADFAGLAQGVLHAGKTPYQRLHMPFNISNGVAQSTQPVLTIDTVSGGINTSIDLPRYWLNAESSLTLNAHMQAPPLGLAYVGPLNTPQFSVRTDQLENHFTQGLLSKSLQRVISNRSAPAESVVAEPAPPPPAPAAVAQPTPPVIPEPKDENPVMKFFNSIIEERRGKKDQ